MKIRRKKKQFEIAYDDRNKNGKKDFQKRVKLTLIDIASFIAFRGLGRI